ncbi:MAG: LysR family transcriptional regulator [Marinobacter sp.]|uniref:LysR family transcriptional regulator n=1 Tax=Marinobacter sp. TaxID=50741 RepID=UPI00299D32DB|nr:LysR family transcriptional regulator [Marinobacter sp.]MDX1756024.1 LysR family transcriptional regulator [Marinobacter sp.]
MNIKLDKLRSFVLVAEEGNLTRAASRRHTTPSAVSEHLRQLEAHFGLTLFERSARGMALTAAGEALVAHARQALKQVSDMDELARSLRGQQPTRLAVGLNAPPEYLKVDQLLRLAARELPEVALELVTSASSLMVGQVLRGELDLGFAYGDFSAEPVLSVPLAGIPLSLIGPVDGGRDALPEQAPERLRLPWIWPAQSCPFYRLMPRVVGGQRDQANTVATSEDEHTTLSMIRAGMGYGLVEHELSRHWADRGSVRMYDAKAISIPLNLLVHPDQRQRPAVAETIALIESLWQPDRDSAAIRSTAT